MTAKKRTTRTLSRWIKALGACSGQRYAGLTLEQAWRRAGKHDEQEWIIENGLNLKHGNDGIEHCWCSKPKGRFKNRVFAKFKNWQRART